MESRKLKEILQNSTREPSANSWEVLQDKLESQDKAGAKSWKTLLKYAAIILVLFSIGIYFYNAGKAEVNTPIIVEPTKKEELKKMPDIQEVSPIEVAEVPKEKVQPKVQKVVKSITSSPIKNKEAIASTNAVETKVLPIEKNINLVEIEKDVAVIVAENKEQNNVDTEIELLLLNAQLDRNLKKSKQSRKVVSANALLDAVEDDLDKDLKQQLFESIMNTLKNPKEVVTDIGN